MNFNIVFPIWTIPRADPCASALRRGDPRPPFSLSLLGENWSGEQHLRSLGLDLGYRDVVEEIPD